MLSVEAQRAFKQSSGLLPYVLSCCEVLDAANFLKQSWTPQDCNSTWASKYFYLSLIIMQNQEYIYVCACMCFIVWSS